MQIQVNTDHRIEAGERLSAYLTEELASALSRFDGWLTRVEVHISEEGAPPTETKRCVMEARPAGAQPIVARHEAGSVDEACTGATLKLEKALDAKYSRKHEHKGGESIRHLPVTEQPA
ncbi:HPF/RaiA family ribosome-associated protein [Amycolatopsis sp. 195334CR]|uniref:HPF/RaiA family ribosome-associated protein n=1 Tax=Amycolatopsis sp. 195334CR TaxID=2814588 RepID=UPI001A8F58EC|nr:HPF/RaiA family ribosome-associated protein [Amycolatopsis sp. 195334CR]MBN6040616.1 HPF/RaiA family ribosome-associated protein [Amycolatopsis sp. 195334CR]